MGAFQGLKDVSRGYNSNKVRPGQYVVRIDGCDYFTTEQYGDKWKNTLTVLAVERGDHKVGEQVHTFFSKSSGNKVFLRKLKGFLAGVNDVADDLITEAVAEEALGDESPMLGKVTVITVVEKTSQKTTDDDGNPVKYLEFSWSPELSDEEIVEAIGEEAVAQFFPNGL